MNKVKSAIARTSRHSNTSVSLSLFPFGINTSLLRLHFGGLNRRRRPRHSAKLKVLPGRSDAAASVQHRATEHVLLMKLCVVMVSFAFTHNGLFALFIQNELV